ncbi:MAG: periplasmic heavy metal sensor [Acidiferrobacterales bacterium]
MSNQETENSTQRKSKAKGGSRRRFMIGLLTGVFVGGLLASGVSAYSHSGSGWWARSGHGHHGMRDPQAAIERMEFASDWMLSRVNASEAQRQQVKAIIESVINDLSLVREKHQASHQAFMDALEQPTIDRAALEQIRATELQRAETASSRVVQAIADAAEVLTPEQRIELIRLAAQFRH